MEVKKVMTAARIILSLITSIGLAIVAAWTVNRNQEVPTTNSSYRRRQNRHDDPFEENHDPLEENDDPSEYQCSKCLQMGFGRRLECRSRNCGHEHHPYQTHAECSNPPYTVTHPSLNGCVFEFRDSGGNDDRLCEACGKGTSGCYYQCMQQHCNKVIHLYCSKLTPTMNVGEIRLVLTKNMTSECSNCYLGLRISDGRKWGYKSLNTDRQLHIYCVKESFPRISRSPQQRNFIRSIGPVDGAEELIAMINIIGSVLT